MAAITLGGAYRPYSGTDPLTNTSRAGNGYQRFSVTTGAVVTLGSSTPAAGAAAPPDDFRHAIITINGAGGVRVRTDATDPTASEGRLIVDGTVEEWENSPDVVRAMRMIGVSGTVEVTVEYFQ